MASVSDTELFLYDSIMVHKCRNGRAPDYRINKFTRRLELHDNNTRYDKDLRRIPLKVRAISAKIIH